MCSLRGVKVITLAAIFCTRCSLRSKLQETPVNSAFPLSNFDMTKAWIRVLVASCVINRLIRLMLWSRRYAPRHTAFTWCSMLSVESYTIPRFFVVASGDIKQPSTVTWMFVATVNLCLVPKVIIFMFFPFSSSLFWRNQESTSSRQCWSSWSAFIWSHGRNEMYSWTSSAYMWKLIPCFLITSPNGEMYIVNNSGPSTDPWGTPLDICRLLDVSFPMRMYWYLSERYEANHSNAGPLTPNRYFSRCNKIEWSIMSKAALKSSNTCTTTNPTSVASIMSLCTGLFLQNGPSCKMIEAAHPGCFRSGMMSFVAQQLSLLSSTGRPSLTRVDSYSRVRLMRDYPSTFFLVYIFKCVITLCIWIMIIISVFVLCTCITVSDFISCAPELIMSIEGIFATDAAA